MESRFHEYLKTAQVFQDIMDHAEGAKHDARKLKNFVERFNRDFADRSNEVTPVTGADKDSLKRTVNSVRQLANQYYARALTVQVLDARLLVSLATRLGASYVEEGRFKDAADVFAEGAKLWKGVPDTPENLKRRVEFFELAVTAAGKSGKKQVLSWAQQSLLEYRKRLAMLNAEEKQRMIRRAVIMGTGEV